MWWSCPGNGGAKRAVVLDVSGPFHSPLMEPASKRLEVALDALTIRDLAVPLVNNVAARLVRSADEVRKGLAQQLTSPVRWEGVVRELMAQGVDTFIELGPGRVLNGLIRGSTGRSGCSILKMQRASKN